MKDCLTKEEEGELFKQLMSASPTKAYQLFRDLTLNIEAFHERKESILKTEVRINKFEETCTHESRLAHGKPSTRTCSVFWVHIRL
jgi:hypothetical protein